MIRPALATAAAALLLCACPKKEEKPASPVTSVATPEARVAPAEVKPAPTAAPTTATAPAADGPDAVYKPTCARLLPKEVLDKHFAGTTLKAAAEEEGHAECVLNKDGMDTAMVVYDCAPGIRENGTQAFKVEREALQGAKELGGVGAAGYQLGNAYRVLDGDVPCRLNISWTSDPGATALEAVKAVEAAATPSSLK